MKNQLPMFVVFVLFICVGSSLGQAKATAVGERVSYSNSRQFFIPFQTDMSKPINEIRLFAQLNGGEWEYLASAEPMQKGFNFATSQDGALWNYGADSIRGWQQHTFQEPTAPDLKVIIDTVPPKIAVQTGLDSRRFHGHRVGHRGRSS